MDETSRVLMVEGSRTVKRIMRTMLSRIGLHSVDETDCGEDAFAMLEETEYAMVTCDWNLGPYDGPSLLRDMRMDPMMRMTPFVMATAMSSKDFDAKAGYYDLTYYLPKPFDQRALETIVASIETAKASEAAPLERFRWEPIFA